LAADRVLIAFAARAGSTATIAEVIGDVLRRYGLDVDARPARDVTDLTPYAGVILGSGMYVPSRHGDGGGFLARHASDLGTRRLWLYCAGPIGRNRCAGGTRTDDSGECSVAAVAADVGARGWAVFGPRVLDVEADPLDRLGPVDLARVRTWAAEIAEELAPPALRGAPTPGSGRAGPVPGVARTSWSVDRSRHPVPHS
jgi:hypothetical protein